MTLDITAPIGFVDPACPINWSHPLNTGLIGEWAIVPNSGWRGSLLLRDLVRGGHYPHDGTLTNGPVWQGSRGRPGSYGSLSFDASNDFVDLGTGVLLSRNFSIFGWFNDTNSGGANRAIYSMGSGNLYLRNKGTLQVLASQTAALAGGATSILSNTWYFAAVTVSVASTATITVYLNGVQDGQATTTQATSTFAGTAQGGTTTPVNNTQPTILYNFIMYAGTA